MPCWAALGPTLKRHRVGVLRRVRLDAMVFVVTLVDMFVWVITCAWATRLQPKGGSLIGRVVAEMACFA